MLIKREERKLKEEDKFRNFVRKKKQDEFKLLKF